MRIYSTKNSQDTRFDITIRFEEGLTARQQSAFEDAADRWSRIITSDLPSAVIEDEEIDDLLIIARGVNIDGPNRVLGRARATHFRRNPHLPIRGYMEFDMADLQAMERRGNFADVVAHEMGHVLGISAYLWSRLGYLQDSDSDHPTYTGPHACREYSALKRSDTVLPVPVENTGGNGTRNSHWRDSVFGNELMTGYIGGRNNPISRITAGCLHDLRYEVDYNAAERYSIPARIHTLDEQFFGGVEIHTECSEWETPVIID